VLWDGLRSRKSEGAVEALRLQPEMKGLVEQDMENRKSISIRPRELLLHARIPALIDMVGKEASTKGAVLR
jgi:hypothetical protein